jgi:hypothetical protein
MITLIARNYQASVQGCFCIIKFKDEQFDILIYIYIYIYNIILK